MQYGKNWTQYGKNWSGFAVPLRKRTAALLLSMLTLVPCLTSCGGQKNVSRTPVSLPDNVVRERVVEVPVPADSALLSALFECDSVGRVILKAYNELKSRNVESRLSFEDGRLDYSATTARDTVYVPVGDSIVYVPQYVEVEVNRLTWKQETWMRVGKVLSALSALLLFFILIRKRLKK